METLALTKIQALSIAILPLIFAITLHEAAHGWVANKCGDKTAFMLGRVSLNPIKHIDLLGTIILPIIMLWLGGFIFGWAKPVPVSWQNLHRPRRDMALVALAGPFTNLLMALAWGLIAKLSIMFQTDLNPTVKTISTFFLLSAKFGIMINCVLLVLNLLPIPPLDGSRVVSSLLPTPIANAYSRIEPYGIWILLALLLFGLLGTLLWPPVKGLINLIQIWFGITS